MQTSLIPGRRLPAVSKAKAKAKARANVLPVVAKTGARVQLPPVNQGLDPMPTADTVAKISVKESNNIMIKSLQREAKLPRVFIIKSLISLYSYEDMKRLTKNIQVVNSEPNGWGSVNDPRMGLVSITHPCGFCELIDCPGHYGRIDFHVKVYNPIFIREVVAVLSCLCGSCGALLFTEEMIAGMDLPAGIERLTDLEKFCRNQPCMSVCFPITKADGTPVLDESGAPVTECGGYRCYQSGDVKERGRISYKEALHKKDIEKAKEQFISIEDVYYRLNRIKREDAVLLGFIDGSHPRDMIFQAILVPPVIARPPVDRGGVMKADDLTEMYISIMKKIERRNENPEDDSVAIYKILRQMIFKSEGTKMGPKAFMSIIEKIQGKGSLMRNLLMGKRDDYCGRTVAGPAPDSRFGGVRLPVVWAPVLTKKLRITDANKARVEQLMAEGKVTHVIPAETRLRQIYSPKLKYTPQVGDQVERFLWNGDRVVINRQPTLHRQSMMGFKVTLSPMLTIGLHLSYTPPMNCDFDGDENNAWIPQDPEVEAEVEILLNVKENLISSENNRPTMGLVMNSAVGIYVLSQPDTMIRDMLFAELLSLIEVRPERTSLSFRLNKYGVHPRSGRAIISALFPADFFYDRDNIIICEGVLVTGSLRKRNVGNSHRSIIQELHKKYGSERTATFLTEAPWIVNKWIIESGFTVGLYDIVNTRTEADGKEVDANKEIIDTELAKIFVQLAALGDPLPDPAEEKYRMRQVKNLVNVAQGVGMKIAKQVLTNKNAIGVMSEEGSGAKGAVANIGQIMGIVGQQFYKGEILEANLTNKTRLLPAYDPNDNDPKAHGFIDSSFYKGLTSTELFLLQTGGREGLLDTALNTAETGNLQRLMIKAFENIIISYDGSVRNTIGTLFLPMYNSGYNIADMVAVKETNKTKQSSFIDLKAVMAELNASEGWFKESTANIVTENKKNLKDVPKETILPTSYRPVTAGSGSSATTGRNLTPPAQPATSTYKITKFEKARIIGARAMQISNNDPPNLAIGNMDHELDPINIALKEYEAGLIRIYVIRRYVDGTVEKVYPTLDNI